ncbi:Retrovirus-related Pol polyprotein from transposon TNT 1-94 [Linum perenne]
MTYKTRRFTLNIKAPNMSSSVMNLGSRQTIYKGRSKDGLYPIPLALFETRRGQPSVHNVTLSTWHRRMGHANLDSVKKLLRRYALPFSNKRLPHICHDCCVGKMHKLPFNSSFYKATGPLDLICSDVWGPSPIDSIDNQRYYIIFFDHYSKYSWIYFVRYRSDLLSIFKEFCRMVEFFFARPIRTFRADWGGEYQKLSQYLKEEGIIFQSSYPHTPEQNGCAERKHRQVTEMGRTLLHQAKLPMKYWSYAFKTAVYLINRLPTTTLEGNDTPYHYLFGVDPDYSLLKTFGCLCFPWLRPYAANKLDVKSSPSVFLGYSVQHKGYFCLNLNSMKIQVSRHVIFDESTFPFQVSMIQSEVPQPPILPTPPLPIPLLLPTNVRPFQAATPTRPPISHRPQQPPVQSQNPPRMVTRSQTGNLKLRTFLASTSPDEEEPTCFTKAHPHKHWREAMDSEFNALLDNNTWTLEPYTPDKKPIGNKWVYRIKKNADGTIARYKARLVAKGFHQQEGLDFTETFSPVIKPASIRLILSIAISNNWMINQLDVSNAFLHGQLDELVYMVQPPGYTDPSKPNHVCRLNKSLYGLKQAPRAWFACLRDALVALGFSTSKTDHSLFYTATDSPLFVLVYVDNIIITRASADRVRAIITQLAARFQLKDLGPLHYFLGVQVSRNSMGMHLSQPKYIMELLAKANLSNAKPVATPLYKPVDDDDKLFDDPQLYQQLLGGLQYLHMTRPDISCATNRLAQSMHNPTMTN